MRFDAPASFTVVFTCAQVTITVIVECGQPVVSPLPESFLQGVHAMGLLWLLISIAELILFIYCIIDIIGKAKSTGWKVLWVVVILIFPVIGSIVYILLGKNS